MMFPATILALATELVVTVADDVSRYDVEPTGRSIAQQGALGVGLDPGETVRQAIESCIKSEMAARDQLVQQWATFTAGQKAGCIGESSAGGQPSYTDLITCLQMARAASKLKE